MKQCQLEIYSHNFRAILIPSPGVRRITLSCTLSPNTDLADQGLLAIHMRIWPGESNVDWSTDLYSLITGLVILSLAECVYSNPLTCSYLLLISCYWQLC